MISEKYVEGHIRHSDSGSAGIHLFPGDANASEKILKDTDTAMYADKLKPAYAEAEESSGFNSCRKSVRRLLEPAPDHGKYWRFDHIDCAAIARFS